MPTKYTVTLDVELEDGASEMCIEELIEDLQDMTRQKRAKVTGGDFKLSKVEVKQ